LPGGTELSFSEAQKQNKPVALATTQAPSSPSGSYGAPDTSGGLRILASLDRQIGRDLNYAKIFNANPKKSWEKEMQDSLDFTEKYVTPAAGCLQAYASMTGDDDFVGSALSAISRDLRAILKGHGRAKDIPSLPHRAVTTLASHLKKIAVAINKDDPPLDKCKSGLELAQSLIDCKDDVCPCRSGNVVCDAMVAHLDSSATQTRPYLRIAAASGLAYAHDYVAALVILDDELQDYDCMKNSSKCKAKDSRGNEKPPIPLEVQSIYESRVRALIGSYIDEWIRYQPAAKSQSVLDYHRINFEAALAIAEPKLKRYLDKMGYRSGDIQFDNYSVASENCSGLFDDVGVPKGSEIPDKTKTIMTMIYSTLTLQKAWLDVVLEDQSYYEKFAWDAKHRAEDMARLKIPCLEILVDDRGQKDAFVKTVQAVAIDSYARVELANVIAPQIAATLSSGEKEKRLRRALQATYTGLAGLAEYQLKERNERASSGTLLERIKASETIETFQSLLATKAKIERSLAEL
jgi:hypothetical protein